MQITYKTEKLQRLCKDPKYKKELIRKYEVEVAQKLPQRIQELEAFVCLNDVPVTPPFRRHKLQGTFENYFAININEQYRLLFQQKSRNNIITNLKEIKEIEIMEVSKHYEKGK